MEYGAKTPSFACISYISRGAWIDFDIGRGGVAFASLQFLRVQSINGLYGRF